MANPAHGVSIPSAYTAYVAPISTPKLYAELAYASASTKSATALDAPYVVLFESMQFLAGQDVHGGHPRVQSCWHFEHGPVGNSGLLCRPDGLPTSNAHNVRTSKMTFFIPHSGVCHGLAGYFEAQLFGNVRLSIYPDPLRASKDMVSWFPLFLPFREPMYLAAHSEIDVHLWRLTDHRRVWYEWSAEAFIVLDRRVDEDDLAQGLPGASARVKTNQTALMNAGAQGSSLRIST